MKYFVNDNDGRSCRRDFASLLSGTDERTSLTECESGVPWNCQQNNVRWNTTVQYIEFSFFFENKYMFFIYVHNCSFLEFLRDLTSVITTIICGLLVILY